MGTQKVIDEILQKRMDRKDFLKHVGMGVAILTGAAGIIKMLKPATHSTGYGSSAYGGKNLQLGHK